MTQHDTFGNVQSETARVVKSSFTKNLSSEYA